MGKGDNCAVLGCGNTRRHPERYVIKEHVKKLKFHSCRKEHFAVWTKLLKRKDYKVTKSTTVCSNHFKYGEPFPVEPHPTFFLKGYPEPVASRPPSRKQKASSQSTTQPSTGTKVLRSVGVQADPVHVDIGAARVEHDHCYAQLPRKRLRKTFSLDYVAHLEDQLHNRDTRCNELKEKLNEAKADVKRLRHECQANTKHLSIGDICHSDELVKLYTGLRNYALFQWLFEEVKRHANNMQCDKDEASQIEQECQRSEISEDEFLMTLMKLKLNLQEEDLAFRFGVSQSTVSRVISTWVPFLDKEITHVTGLVKKKYPQCILHCTEIQIDRPLLAASNAQVYV